MRDRWFLPFASRRTRNDTQGNRIPAHGKVHVISSFETTPEVLDKKTGETGAGFMASARRQLLEKQLQFGGVPVVEFGIGGQSGVAVTSEEGLELRN